MSSPIWTTACPDWRERIVAGQSLVPCPPLFPAEAEAGLARIDAYRLVDVPGSPSFGAVARPWVRKFVASVFGAYDAATGNRLIKEWLLLISKKNGKSTISGLLMLALLEWNWRLSGEMGILAPTVEVANNAFKPAADAVNAEEDLQTLFHVQSHTRTITHRVTGASMQVVAADSDTVAGKKWSITLIDELWLFGKRHNAEDMLREATGGQASRPEGCVIYTTTHSNEPAAGVWRDKLLYARGVRDGLIDDPAFCPVLYEFPEAMLARNEHKLPKNFYITNPNYGLSVDRVYIERELRKAQALGEHSVRGTEAKYLNIEVGASTAHNRWAGVDFWVAAANPALTRDKILDRSDVVIAGIDGGGLDDLLGFSLLGRDADTGRWLHWAHAWAHRIVLERRKEIAGRLLDFEKAGELTFVDLPGQDVEQVAEQLAAVHKRKLFPEKAGIAVDNAGIADIIETATSAPHSLPLELFVGIQQGWRLNSAIKSLERKIAGREFEHCNQDITLWSATNARSELKGNATTISKQASGSGKIDVLLSLFDATSAMLLNPQPAKPKFQAYFM